MRILEAHHHMVAKGYKASYRETHFESKYSRKRLLMDQNIGYFQPTKKWHHVLVVILSTPVLDAI